MSSQCENAPKCRSFQKLHFQQRKETQKRINKANFNKDVDGLELEIEFQLRRIFVGQMKSLVCDVMEFTNYWVATGRMRILRTLFLSRHPAIGNGKFFTHPR